MTYAALSFLCRNQRTCPGHSLGPLPKAMKASASWATVLLFSAAVFPSNASSRSASIHLFRNTARVKPRVAAMQTQVGCCPNKRIRCICRGTTCTLLACCGMIDCYSKCR